MHKKEKLEELLSRSVDKIYPSKDALRKELAGNKKLSVYLGVDPTGPHLHLGHATNLLLLKRFQDLGHKITLLIGDFTARIGDPSNKLSPRKPLSKKEVEENLKTFKKQAGSIINFAGKNPAVLGFNSDWLAKMSFEDVLGLAGNFTVQQMMKREMFQKRLAEDRPINLREFFYPLMQGYDSVALNTDIEIGGTDQTFNMLVGRDLIKIYKNKEKFVITTKLLENPKTGNKLMNKSEGGLINLDDEPKNMFGKIMALDDEVVGAVAEHSTLMPIAEVKGLKKKHPKEAKTLVAFEAVKLYHGEKAADNARAEFVKVFSKKELPSELPELKTKKRLSVADLVVLAGAKSKNEAKRLVEQGGIKINDKTKSDPYENISLKNGDTLKVGKRKFFRIKT